MQKIKLSDLSTAEQLDVLSRVYIREVTKPINKWLAGSVRKAGGEQSAQLNMGKVKNMFLSGSMEANDFAYAVGNSKYEQNRFSIIGGLYNYIYRSKLIDELKTSYNVEKGVFRAYGYVKTYGYQNFYTYEKTAFVPTVPSSIIDKTMNEAKSRAGRFVLDEGVSTSNIILEDFSKKQIAIIKEYIKEKASTYMRAQGFSEHDIEAVLGHINRMRTSPFVPKSKIYDPVKKPSKKLEGFLISMPQEDLTKEVIQNNPHLEQTSSAVIDKAQEIAIEEKPERTRELDERESVMQSMDDKYDLLGDQYADIEDAIVYGSIENLVEEEDEKHINGITYKNGYMVTDGGYVVSPKESPYEDVEDTRLKNEPEPSNEIEVEFKSCEGTQLKIDFDQK